MLKTRIIPCLDVADGRVVKGVNFIDLVDAGDPVEAAKAYDAAGADEKGAAGEFRAAGTRVPERVAGARMGAVGLGRFGHRVRGECVPCRPSWAARGAPRVGATPHRRHAAVVSGRAHVHVVNARRAIRGARWVHALPARIAREQT